jgi:hypothetical protein
MKHSLIKWCFILRERSGQSEQKQAVTYRRSKHDLEQAANGAAIWREGQNVVADRVLSSAEGREGAEEQR